MQDCGKCLHQDVCKTAETCDGHVPRCKHFMDKDGMALASCKLGAKGCFTDGKCRYKKACENKVMTHADQLRVMTEEELAPMIFAYKLGYAPWCDHHCENEGDDGCDNCILKWLKQFAEEGAT